jgi:geranylgeranyl diphosphate synthase type I
MSLSADLNARLEHLSGEVDAWTRAHFERYRPSSDRFAGMLRYPLGWVATNLRPLERPASAGKRLRSTLCLLICESLCGNHAPALPAASAIELVHNFSLVHDDIQDASPLRRGRPTVWAQWQTPQAINVGDSLFALAQLALLHADAATPEFLVEAARKLNATCLRLVEGQYLDLELQSTGSAPLEAYQSMVSGKTAALLECAAWLGACFGGASSEQAHHFASFGHQLGIAFQFQDDVLGVWGDPERTGKSSDADLRTRKQALPAVLALQLSGPEADQFRRLFLAPGEMSRSDAHAARLILERLGVRERAAEMASSGYDRAQDALRTASGGEPNSILASLLRRFRARTA